MTYRRLAKARPDAFLPDLARSLWAHGDSLVGVEHTEPAIDVGLHRAQQNSAGNVWDVCSLGWNVSRRRHRTGDGLVDELVSNSRGHRTSRGEDQGFDCVRCARWMTSSSSSGLDGWCDRHIRVFTFCSGTDSLTA